ncbi:hypothetical protein Glove_217g185 [Diversispora epigaea]|uniref:Protein kinase domain-containing protein n=1 Tax=Diversispora epigaea TaxID=1348612 RepID=A0A397IPL5_9GLOM|nr:hypothetical protein Glove_217g185 [Diversispora epigaea]
MLMKVLRQYLQANLQKLDWNIKLNLAKQIANVLMFLHSNDIIHGHCTIVKNKSSDIFCLRIILWEISSGNSPFEMEYLSSVDLLNNISKGKPHCLKHNRNSRPDIFQVVKNLSKIILSDASFEFETPQSQPYNSTDENKLEKFKIQYREIRPISVKNYIREQKKESS